MTFPNIKYPDDYGDDFVHFGDAEDQNRLGSTSLQCAAFSFFVRPNRRSVCFSIHVFSAPARISGQRDAG